MKFLSNLGAKLKSLVTPSVKKVALIGGGALAATGAFAQDSNVTNAQAIVSTATSTFGTVAVLTVTMVGFWVVIKIVRKAGKS